MKNRLKLNEDEIISHLKNSTDYIGRVISELNRKPRSTKRTKKIKKGTGENCKKRKVEVHSAEKKEVSKEAENSEDDKTVQGESDAESFEDIENQETLNEESDRSDQDNETNSVRLQVKKNHNFFIFKKLITKKHSLFG